MKIFFFYFLLIAILALSYNQVHGQFIWTKDIHNPVLSGGAENTWNTQVFLPCVLYNPDSSRFEMWFGATLFPYVRPYQIGFATSEDGITWEMLSTPVLSPTVGGWDASTVEQQAVIREDGQYKMWYTGWSSSGSSHIGYATSIDGINWTKHPDPVFEPGTSEWEIGGPYGCDILPVMDEYRMWYGSFNAASGLNEIGYATSADGIVWQRDTVNNPVLIKGDSSQWDVNWVLPDEVLLIDNTYFMWYDGEYGVFPNVRRHIGIATSLDGIHWTKYESNPVLTLSPGEWDASVVEGGCVLLKDDTLHMWYNGNNYPASTLFKIGHAISPLVTSIDLPDVRSQIRNFILEQNYPNPFNPKTTIRYALPVTCHLDLSIYNILGQKVAMLVNKKQSAGNYSVEWNASAVSSGIYYYRLKAEGFSAVKKMVVIK